jgi:hypothetical protein
MRVMSSQADLDRANIQMAWAFAWRMTPAHFEELCRVTVEQLRRDAREDVRDAA